MVALKFASVFAGVVSSHFAVKQVNHLVPEEEVDMSHMH